MVSGDATVRAASSSRKFGRSASGMTLGAAIVRNYTTPASSSAGNISNVVTRAPLGGEQRAPNGRQACSMNDFALWPGRVLQPDQRPVIDKTGLDKVLRLSICVYAGAAAGLQPGQPASGDARQGVDFRRAAAAARLEAGAAKGAGRVLRDRPRGKTGELIPVCCSIGPRYFPLGGERCILIRHL